MADAKGDKPARARRSRFDVANDVPDTKPTAGAGRLSAVPSAAAGKTARRPGTETASAPKARAAYTWRRTPAEALAMDELTIRLKRELERAKLDHSEILAALVEIATENHAVFGALAGKLQQPDS